MDLDCVSGKLKSIAKDQKVDYLNLGTQANEFSQKTDELPLPWLFSLESPTGVLDTSSHLSVVEEQDLKLN